MAEGGFDDADADDVNNVDDIDDASDANRLYHVVIGRFLGTTNYMVKYPFDKILPGQITRKPSILTKHLYSKLYSKCPYDCSRP